MSKTPWYGFFFFLGFLFLPDVGRAEAFNFDVDSENVLQLSDSTYIILNHASSWWDKTESTKAATRAFLQSVAHSHRHPKVIALMSPSARTYQDHKNSYYFSSAEVNIKVASSAGTHRLVFSNASHLIFAGGNFSSCLCEAIRDSIDGANKVQRKLELTLLTDAIYDHATLYKSPLPPAPPGETVSLPLKTLTSGMSDEELKSFFLKEILGDRVQFCPHQFHRTLSPKLFHFILRRNKRVIAKIGESGKLIDIDFSSNPPPL